MDPVRDLAFAHELAQAKELVARSQWEAAFRHLERAHARLPIEPELKRIIDGVPPARAQRASGAP